MEERLIKMEDAVGCKLVIVRTAATALILCLTVATSLGSVFGYTVGYTTSTYVGVTNGTILDFEGDEGAATVPLPFSFAFFGQVKTSVTVSANLYLTFGTVPAGAASYVNECPLDTTTPNDVVALFWDDGVRGTTSPTGQVVVATYGVAPHRVFAVEFRNWDFFYQVGPNYVYEGASATQQVLLYESGDIEFRYGPRSGAFTKAGTLNFVTARGRGEAGRVHGSLDVVRPLAWRTRRGRTANWCSAMRRR